MIQPSHTALPAQFTTLLLTLEQIAQSYFISGHLAQALQVLQTGAPLANLPEVAPHDRASFLLHYGNMLARKTQYQNAPVEEALALLEQARQLATELHNEQTLADALDGIGFAHYVAANNRRQGDPHMILSYFQDALERRRQLHDDRGVSESLFHVGLISALLGQNEAADASFTQVLQIARPLYPAEAAEALRHLGFHEQAAGNLPQARHYFTAALQLLEDAELTTFLPFAHQTLADLCLAQGDLEQAALHCQQALDLARHMDIKKALIFSLLTSGSLALQKQDQQQARNYFAQAYQEAQAIAIQHLIQRASSALQSLPSSPEE